MFTPYLNCKICGGEIAPDAEHNNGACLGCGAECMYPKADVKKLNRITYLRNSFDFARAECHGLADVTHNNTFWILLFTEC